MRRLFSSFHRIRTVDGQLSPWPVVMNVFASRQRCAFAVGGNFETLGREMHERRAQRIKPVVVPRSEAPVKEVVTTGDAVKAREIPALVHAAWDPGPCIPMGFLTTYDPDTGIDNCALQRGWIYDGGEIRIFANRSSHNGQNIKKVEERGEDVRVAYWIGHHPAGCLGAGVKLRYPESHGTPPADSSASPFGSCSRRRLPGASRRRVRDRGRRAAWQAQARRALRRVHTLHRPPNPKRHMCYCMHMLERRVQILLDERRYQKIAAEAEQRGLSIAAVIRDAIDQLPADAQRRREAVAEILAAEPMSVPADPSDLRRELDTAHSRESA